MAGDDKPRRSAGMRGDPKTPTPEQRPVSTVPKIRAEPPPAPRAAASPHPRPQVLMGEVAAPRGSDLGEESASRRKALREFMAARRLTPSLWCARAGLPTGELMAFLTARSPALSAGTARKLADAAGVSPRDLFG